MRRTGYWEVAVARSNREHYGARSPNLVQCKNSSESQGSQLRTPRNAETWISTLPECGTLETSEKGEGAERRWDEEKELSLSLFSLPVSIYRNKLICWATGSRISKKALLRGPSTFPIRSSVVIRLMPSQQTGEETAEKRATHEHCQGILRTSLTGQLKTWKICLVSSRLLGQLSCLRNRAG